MRNLCFLLTLVATLLLLPGRLIAAALPQDDKLITGQLENGLRYMIYPHSHPKEGANKQVISSQADSLIKISRIWADFFPANTSNQPI
ncbi:hypothetical protein K7A35_03160 [Escherichia marmotae]|nr:hypothetical protein [Escherichia marmotae]